MVFECKGSLNRRQIKILLEFLFCIVYDLSYLCTKFNVSMSKGKLQKFAEMETFSNVFQYPFSVIEQVPFDMKGHWHEDYFHNTHPIVLELGCGKGEYTVELAKLYPEMNFIGVEIKGFPHAQGCQTGLG